MIILMNLLIFLYFFSFLVLFLGFFSFFSFNLYFKLLDFNYVSLLMDFGFLKILFFFFLMLVVFSVVQFINFYLDSELFINYFIMVLMIFVLSMVFLNFSGNYFLLILSWDMLGISSYFLVLFYNNWDSNIGSMNVSLTNRLGDYFMFFFFSFFFFLSFKLNYVSLLKWNLVICMLVMGFTKSAQFPFSSWLPKAMSAPTPVSALVHSSTLVTAGLILFLNYKILFFNGLVLMVLFFFGILTMLFASIMSLMEDDLKKVVALSTLSQMGFSVMILGLGLNYFCLMHLMSHALFKSCLFIQIGVFIYFSLGQQDGRKFSGLNMFYLFFYFQMLITLFCLCGLFFSSGMMSKDLILELFFFNNVNFFIYLIFFFSVLMTFFYSYRLFGGLFNMDLKIYLLNLSFTMVFMSIFLVILSVSGIYILMKNLFILPSLFLMFDLFTPIIFIFFFFFMYLLMFFFKVLSLKYSFMVDYLAKMMSFFLVNMKFLDLFMNKAIIFNLNNFLKFKNLNIDLNFIFFNLIFIFLIFYF